MRSFQLPLKLPHLGICLYKILVCCFWLCVYMVFNQGIQHIIVIEETYTGFLLILKRDDQLKFHWGVNNLRAMVAGCFMSVTRTGNRVRWLVICLINQDPLIGQVLPVSLVQHQLILESSLVITVGMDQAGQLGQKACLQRYLSDTQGTSLQHLVLKTLWMVCINQSLQRPIHLFQSRVWSLQRPIHPFQSRVWNKEETHENQISLKWYQNNQWPHQNHRCNAMLCSLSLFQNISIFFC